MSSDDAVAALAARMHDRIDPLLDQTVTALRAQVPGYGPHDGLTDEDVRDTLRIYLLDLLDDLSGTRLDNSSALDAQMRRRVEQGITLPDLLHSYRLGVEQLWLTLATIAHKDHEATDALVAATPIVFESLDRYSLRASHIHQEVALRRARRDEQVRAALLDVVLTRDPSIGAAFWDAVAQLGVPRDGRFLAVEIRDTGDDRTEPPPDIEAGIVRLPGVDGAWFRVGPRSQTALLSVRRTTPTDTDAALWTTILERDHLVAGISAEYPSIAGTPRASAQAHVAAAAVSRRRRLVRYDRDLLPVLLASAPNAADVLVRETIGPVLDQPADRRDALLDTVRVWLETGQSLAASARRLHCHRNTVTYRLNRFQQLTGRQLTDNVWLTQVVLALEAAETRSPD
ncbi:PucR family transcriptional regulator [Cryptosporangium phraense]|uniref:PucR family transcriptional regulator n=1 Tax=Cryptosporangium phraense TaxID=2593070 RepID=A0A545AQ01_9ACTN|nr:helix-turn-helix domain-containing protein [Cryptosporangium phraense]TQS43373.1 PucR family transcriptional regulator [Cryptosporangium phraense]